MTSVEFKFEYNILFYAKSTSVSPSGPKLKKDKVALVGSVHIYNECFGTS